MSKHYPWELRIGLPAFLAVLDDSHQQQPWVVSLFQWVPRPADRVHEVSALQYLNDEKLKPRVVLQPFSP